MGPRWKGKDSKEKALAEPMSEIVSALQSSLSRSHSKGMIEKEGCTVQLEVNTEQSELLNRACFGRPNTTTQKDKQWYDLNLQEAFYLSYSLKCLKIVGIDGNELTDKDLWHEMVSKFERFPEFYKAYSHLRMNNWVVRSGSQYGVDYVAYRHHPALVHSEYAILVLSDKPGSCGGRLRLWSDLYGTIRVCGGVAKTLLVLHILGMCTETDFPTCLRNYKIEARTISRWIPEQARENRTDSNFCSESKTSF